MGEEGVVALRVWTPLRRFWGGIAWTFWTGASADSELEARDLLLEAGQDVLAGRVADLRRDGPQRRRDRQDLLVVREVDDLLYDVVRERVDEEQLDVGRRLRVADDLRHERAAVRVRAELEALLDDVRRKLVPRVVDLRGAGLVRAAVFERPL